MEIMLKTFKPTKSNQGFTLTELLIGLMILLPLCTITMKLFIDCTQLNKQSMNTAQALSALIDRMSVIEKTSFNQILSSYNNQTFTLNGFDGRGVSYITATNANYVTVTLSFSWREDNDRVIGEDKDLDGVIDTGEDINGNGRLDSPVQITSIVYNT
jgi:prepilin-type N-terminal cleavage/methylation domain-containing protein